MTDDERFRLETRIRFLGFQLIADDVACSELVRVRTHKKKRIDKKWRKRYGYKRIPKNELYICKEPRLIIGHSKHIEMVIRECQKNDGVAKGVCFR